MKRITYHFKILLFFVIINVLIIGINSFKYYKAFNLLSKSILLITDEGFIKYNSESKTQDAIKIINDTSINKNYEIDFISFAQFALDEGGYVFGRIRQNIYYFSKDLDFYGNFTVSNIIDSIISMIPYTSKNGDKFIIIGYIDSNYLISLLMYKIDFVLGESKLLYSVSKNTVNEDKLPAFVSFPKKVSCQLMSKLDNDKIIVCFSSNDDVNRISAVVFDPENELSLLYYSNNTITSEAILNIYSEITPNKNISLVCIIDMSSHFACLLYFSDSNKFGELKNFMLGCKSNDFYMGIKYIGDKQEYSGFCATYSYEMNIIIFDENFNVKKVKENNKCYTVIHYVDYDQSESLLCSSLIYDEYYHNYFISRNFNDTFFDYFQIPEECTFPIKVTGLDLNETNQQISSLPSSILSTSPTIISEKSSLIVSPSSTISTFTTTISEKSSIIVPPSSTISTSLSTIFKKSTNIVPSSFSISTFSTTISKKSTIIILPSSTISISPITTTKKSTINTLPSSTILTSPTSISKKSTIIIPPSSIISTSPTTISEKTTVISLHSSSIISKKSISIFTISSSSIISEKSTIIIPNSSILSIASSFISINPTTIYSTPTTIFSTIKPSVSTIILPNITSISSLLYTSIISKELKSYIFNSTILSIINKKNNTIFYQDGEIMKGKINETKEEFQNNLDNFMNNIEIGKIYKINGEDYNVTISPINIRDSHNSTYVDLSVCESILRKKLNISQAEILTIMQIEIDKKNGISLNNQVEYSIYDSQKKKLNLSYCKEVQIKVNYKIVNEFLLNKSEISYYSKLGIDIFDSQDSFFNDICYPFSNSNSDIVLKDRILDIYQNYSLCDNGCEYDQIDIEEMLITCSCQVKIEINTKVSEPDFKTVFKDTFKESNFGVIKCFNLVFSLKNKKHNIGFMIYLVFILFHIICFIYYFIFGIKSIILFVYKEMDKNNYFSKINSPKKKKITDKSHDNDGSNFYFNNKKRIITEQKVKKNILKRSKTMFSKKKNYNNTINSSSKSIFNKGRKKKKPQQIFIFNYKYNNSYFNINNNSSKKSLKHYKNSNKKLFKGKSKLNNSISSINKEKNFPGYYNLIQINANNSFKNKPPQSKYILDNYSYEEAIKYDKRSIWRIYYIMILSKENILNTFFFKTPLELLSLRLSLFIFNNSCDLALNSLFYYNQKISDKYHYEGDSLYLFILINNITVTISSFAFSYLLIKCLNILTNSKDQIESVFRREEKLMRKDKTYYVNSKQKKIIHATLQKIFKFLKIKIMIYIIIEFSLLLFFFYYITAFCEVYKETQKSWIYDSFISFILSNIYELLASFFISLIYETSLKYRIKLLYRISMFFYELG